MGIGKNSKKLARIPIKRLPLTTISSPREDTPPDVPAPTFFLRLVINRGLDLLSRPISVANVSAIDVAIAPKKQIKKISPPKKKFARAEEAAIPPLAKVFLHPLLPPFSSPNPSFLL